MIWLKACDLGRATEEYKTEEEVIKNITSGVSYTLLKTVLKNWL